MSVADHRYCAMGEECSQYSSLGEPTKLRKTSESEICEACRSADQKAESKEADPESTGTKPKPSPRHDREKQGEVLASSAEIEIRRLKRELVLSLVTKRGCFWESVKEVRESWSIEPSVGVPPSTVGNLHALPPWVPEGRPDPYEKPQGAFEFLTRWWVSIRGIQEQVIPEKYRQRGGPGEWDRFLAACALYDPPETELLAFAAFADPEPEGFYGSRMPEEADPEESLPLMLAPPVKTLHDLTRSEDWVWDCLIYDHVERLKSVVELSGIDPYELLTKFENEDPGLRERYLQKVRRDESRYFIEVDERMTQEDVVNSFRLIRAAQGTGAARHIPTRDRLTAVQCAILHDKYKLPYAEVAKRYDLGSKDSAKNYVTQGRGILQDGGGKITT